MSRYRPRRARLVPERLEARQLLAAEFGNDFVIHTNLDDYGTGGSLVRREAVPPYFGRLRDTTADDIVRAPTIDWSFAVVDDAFEHTHYFASEFSADGLNGLRLTASVSSAAESPSIQIVFRDADQNNISDADGNVILHVEPLRVLRRGDQFASHVGPRRQTYRRVTAEIRFGHDGVPDIPAGADHFTINANVELVSAQVTPLSDLPGIETFGDLPRIATVTSQQSILGDAARDIDPADGVHLSARVRGDAPTSVDTHRVGYVAEDADGLPIQSHHVTRYAGAADTTLAAPVQPGDTTITLVDASGWSDSMDPGTRSLAWYGYTDGTGVTHADYTYTRHVAGDATEGLWPVRGIDGNVITLTRPWSGPALPAGAAVRNAAGGDETLRPVLLNDIGLNDQWRHLSAAIRSTWTDGTPDVGSLPPGTASIRAAAMFNTTNPAADDGVILDRFFIASSAPEPVVADAAGAYSFTFDLPPLPADSVDNYILGEPSFGTLAWEDSDTVRYTAPAGFVGTDRFPIGLQDDWHYTDYRTVSITGANHHLYDAPAGFDARTVAESLAGDANGATTAVAMRSEHFARDREYFTTPLTPVIVDGSVHPRLADDGIDFVPNQYRDLSFTLLEAPDRGLLDFRSDGTFVFEPDGWWGGASFRYAVFDGVQMETATIRIHSNETRDQIVARNLDRIADAVQAYHDTFATLPVGTTGTRDPDGDAYFSWRVALLPFLGYQELWDRITATAPFDDGLPADLVSRMPAVYGDGTDPLSTTTVLQRPASTGPFTDADQATGLVTNQITQFRDILDGPQMTLMVVEVGDELAVPWHLPSDVAFDPGDPLATLGTAASVDTAAVMFDGTVVDLTRELSPDVFAALTTRWGGEVIDPDNLRREGFLSFEAEPIDVRLSRLQNAVQYFARSYQQMPTAGRGRLDASGQPLLSWRVHILPYLGHANLYDQFRQDEPWDSPHNAALLPMMPDIFRDASQPNRSSTTRLVMPTGDETIVARYPDGRLIPHQYGRIGDGLSNTILIVKGGTNQTVPWTAPDAVNFDPADIVDSWASISDGRDTIPAVTFAGDALQLPGDLPPNVYAAAVTTDGDVAANPFEAQPLDSLALRGGWTDTSDISTSGESGDKLKEVALAVHDYHATFRTLPVHADPTDFPGGDLTATPNLSWRVHLLPFLGHQRLYEQFRLDEPWDSPHNASLLPLMPAVYLSPGDDPATDQTRVQRFTGEADPDGRCDRRGPIFCDVGPGPGFRDVLDGNASTLMLVETGPDVAVPWTAPIDVQFSIDDLLDPRPGLHGPLGDVGESLFVAFADTMVVRLDAQTAPRTLSAMITRANREVIDGHEMFAVAEPSTPAVVAEGGIATYAVAFRGNVGNRSSSWDDASRAVGQTYQPVVTVSDPSAVDVFVDPEISYGPNEATPRMQVVVRAVDDGVIDPPRDVTVTIDGVEHALTIIEPRPATPGPPSLRDVAINGGSATRSNVESITLRFDGLIDPSTVAAGVRVQDAAGNPVSLDGATVSDDGIHSTAVISFDATDPRTRPGTAALIDGEYRVIVDGGSILSADGRQTVDAAANGNTGSTRTFGDAPGDAFFALLGDYDGNGSVNFPDFLSFANAYLTDSPAHDVDSNGTVNFADFMAFADNYNARRGGRWR